MNRLLDFLNAILGRKKGTALILATLGEFDRIMRSLDAGLQHLDQEVEARQQTIQQEEAAIVQLRQVAMRATAARTHLAALSGQH